MYFTVWLGGDLPTRCTDQKIHCFDKIKSNIKTMEAQECDVDFCLLTDKDRNIPYYIDIFSEEFKNEIDCALYRYIINYYHKFKDTPYIYYAHISDIIRLLGFLFFYNTSPQSDYFLYIDTDDIITKIKLTDRNYYIPFNNNNIILLHRSLVMDMITNFLSTISKFTISVFDPLYITTNYYYLPGLYAYVTTFGGPSSVHGTSEFFYDDTLITHSNISVGTELGKIPAVIQSKELYYKYSDIKNPRKINPGEHIEDLTTLYVKMDPDTFDFISIVEYTTKYYIETMRYICLLYAYYNYYKNIPIRFERLCEFAFNVLKVYRPIEYDGDIFTYRFGTYRVKIRKNV